MKQRRRNTEDYMSKRKIWTRRGCRIVLFVLAAAFMLYCLDRIRLVKRTDGILTMQNFYAQDPGTVDVLILGSSHAGMNLDTGVLWEEEGIASYILWGSMQPFWNTYYFLQEALKTQTPDAVVLDVFAATYSFEYSDDARQVTNTAGMKPSLTKLKAIRHSAPRSRWIDLALGFPLYHDRYSEITAEDFQYFFWSRRQTEKKGCGRRFGTGEVTLEKVTGEEPAAPLYEKERQYLLEIIDLCSRRGIPLILINTPTAHRAAEQPYYQAVRQIAADTGVPYYNLNEMDDVTGITKQDYWTDSEHLNSEGAAKTRFEKTRDVANYPPARKYLHVCTHDDGPCCNTCEKCCRTIMTLDALGRLDDFRDIFDVDYYRRNRKWYLNWMYYNWYFFGKESLLEEVYAHFKGEVTLGMKLKMRLIALRKKIYPYVPQWLRDFRGLLRGKERPKARRELFGALPKR